MGNNCCTSKERLDTQEKAGYQQPLHQGNTAGLQESGPEIDQLKQMSPAKEIKDPHKEYEGDKDYEIPSTEGIADKYEVFECQLPFIRTHLKRFMEKVDKAAQSSKTNGSVTIKDLSEELKTEAWKDLVTKDSILYKFMTSGIFKIPENSNAENLDIRRLKIFGLLHCQQTAVKKAPYFYEFLQTGGKEKFNAISSSDKDFKPVVKMICELACWELFNAVKKSGSDIGSLYTLK